MTRKTDQQKWRCDNCEAVFLMPAFLEAPSPFDSKDVLYGCPECKCCTEGFTELCDESDCKAPATCGFPTGDDNDSFGGYRRTCGKHYRDFETKKQQA
jgi:hypothetical protein